MESVISRLSRPYDKMEELEKDLQDTLRYLEWHVVPDYSLYVSCVWPNLFSIFKKGDELNHVCRVLIIQIVSRCQPHEDMRVFAEEFVNLLLMFLKVCDENAGLLVCKVVIDWYRFFKTGMETQIQLVMSIIKDMYMNFVNGGFEIHRNKTGEHVYHTDKMSKETKEYADNGTRTALNRRVATKSYKVLSECPVVIVLFFQLYKKFMLEIIPQTLQVMMDALSDQEMYKNIDESDYNDYITAFVKTFSLLAYILKGVPSLVKPYYKCIPVVIINFLKRCPKDSIYIRKEIIISLKHIFSTDIRYSFIPYIGDLLEEEIFLGSGFSSCYILKHLSFSVISDLIHYVRTDLPPGMIIKVIEMYSDCLHDHKLPVGIQIISAKIMSGLVGTLSPEKIGGGDRTAVLWSMFYTYVSKLRSFKIQMLLLLENKEHMVDTDGEDDKKITSSLKCKSGYPGHNGEEVDESYLFLSKLYLHENKSMNSSFSHNEIDHSFKDHRFLLRNLILGIKSIVLSMSANIDRFGVAKHTRFLKDCGMDKVEKLISMFRDAITCFSIYKTGAKLGGSVPHSQYSVEDKEVLDSFSYILTTLDTSTFTYIMSSQLDFFVNGIIANPILLVLPQYLLSVQGVSNDMMGLLLPYLTERLGELKSSSNSKIYVYLRLFKLVFLSVSVFQEDNEGVLQQYMHCMLDCCVENNMYNSHDTKSTYCKEINNEIQSSNPYPGINYYYLLRSLFRCIGGGKFELLYKEILPYLSPLLDSLNGLLLTTKDLSTRELFIELCLTIPVRLSVLLPHLSYLMKPLVFALSSSSELVGQGLRTLELCIDNLTQNFLDHVIDPIIVDLLKSLWNHCKPLPYPTNYSHVSLRILGKLARRCRKVLTLPPLLECSCLKREFFYMEFEFCPTESDRDTIVVKVPYKLLLDEVSSIMKANGPGIVEKSLAFSICKSMLEPLILREVDALDMDLFHLRVLYMKTIIENITTFGYFLTSLPNKESQEEIVDGVILYLKDVFTKLLPVLCSEDERLFPLVDVLVDSIMNGQWANRSLCINQNLETSVKDVGDAVFQHTIKGVVMFTENIPGDTFNLETEPVLRRSELKIFSHLMSRICLNCYENTDNICHMSTYYRFYFLFNNQFTTSESVLPKKLLTESWFREREMDIIRAFVHSCHSLSLRVNGSNLEGYKYTLEIIKNILCICHEGNDLENHESGDKDVYEGRSLSNSIIGGLLESLYSSNSYVRRCIECIFEFMAKIQKIGLYDLFFPFKDEISNNLLPKNGTSLPLMIQLGILDTLSYFLEIKPSFLDFNDDFSEFVQDVISFVDTDDHVLVRKYPEIKNVSSIVKFRVSCIKVLDSIVVYSKFQSPKQLVMRNRIISIFFKGIYANNKETIDMSMDGLSKVISVHHKLPKDLLQHGLRPVLMNLSDCKRFTVSGLNGLGRLLKLLKNYFKVEIGRKLLDYIKRLMDKYCNNTSSGHGDVGGNSGYQNTSIDSNELSIIISIFGIFHLLPSNANIFFEEVVYLVISLETHLRKADSNVLRKPIFSYILKYANDCTGLFLGNIEKFLDPVYMKMFSSFLSMDDSMALRKSAFFYLPTLMDRICERNFPTERLHYENDSGYPSVFFRAIENWLVVVENIFELDGCFVLERKKIPRIVDSILKEELGQKTFQHVFDKSMHLWDAFIKVIGTDGMSNNKMEMLNLFSTYTVEVYIIDRMLQDASETTESKRKTKNNTGIWNNNDSGEHNLSLRILSGLVKIFSMVDSQCRTLNVFAFKGFIRHSVIELNSKNKNDFVKHIWESYFKNRISSISEEKKTHINLLVTVFQVILIPVVTASHGEPICLDNDNILRIRDLFSIRAKIDESLFVEFVQLGILFIHTNVSNELVDELLIHILLFAIYHLKVYTDPICNQCLNFLISVFFASDNPVLAKYINKKIFYDEIILDMLKDLLSYSHFEMKSLTRKTLFTLVPCLPRLFSKHSFVSIDHNCNVPIWIKVFYDLLSDDLCTPSYYSNIWKLILSFLHIFYPFRRILLTTLFISLPKLSIGSSSNTETKLLSIDLSFLVWKWETPGHSSLNSIPDSGSENLPQERTPPFIIERIIKLLIKLSTAFSSGIPVELMIFQDPKSCNESYGNGILDMLDMYMRCFKTYTMFLSQDYYYNNEILWYDFIFNSTMTVFGNKGSVGSNAAVSLPLSMFEKIFSSIPFVSEIKGLLDKGYFSEAVNTFPDEQIPLIISLVDMLLAFLIPFQGKTQIASQEMVNIVKTHVPSLFNRIFLCGSHFMVVRLQPLVEKIYALCVRPDGKTDFDDVWMPNVLRISSLEEYANKNSNVIQISLCMRVIFSIHKPTFDSYIHIFLPCYIKSMGLFNNQILDYVGHNLEGGTSVSLPSHIIGLLSYNINMLEFLSLNTSVIDEYKQPFVLILSGLLDCRIPQICIKILLEIVYNVVLGKNEPIKDVLRSNEYSNVVPTSEISTKSKVYILTTVLKLIENLDSPRVGINEKIFIYLLGIEGDNRRFLRKGSVQDNILEILYNVYSVKSYHKTDICIDLENEFLLSWRGCFKDRNGERVSHETRNLFLLLIDKSISRSVYSRLEYIFKVQNWAPLGRQFWIQQCLELVMISSKQADGVRCTGKGEDLLDALIMLTRERTKLASRLWTIVFGDLWVKLKSLIPSRMYINLESGILDIFGKSYHNLQSPENINTVETLMEMYYTTLYKEYLGNRKQNGIKMLSPSLVKFLSKTFNAWYSGVLILEFGGKSNRYEGGEDRTGSDSFTVPQDPLSELYILLNENDMFYGYWRKYCLFGETNMALTLEQHGYWEASQMVYESAQSKANAGLFPYPIPNDSEVGGDESNSLQITPAMEFSFWEERWIECAKKLQQWDIIVELSKIDNHIDLSLNGLWHILDWNSSKDQTVIRSALDYLVDSPTPQRKIFETFMHLNQLSSNKNGAAEFQKLTDDTHQCLLRYLNTLPRILNQAHNSTLHYFQKIVEVREVYPIYQILSSSSSGGFATFGSGNGFPSNISGGNKFTMQSHIHELKNVITTWRERLPNKWDDINIWSELVAWRQHVFSAINIIFQGKTGNGTYGESIETANAEDNNKALGSSGTPSNTSQKSFGYRGYHETAWMINKFARFARKNNLPNVCIQMLNKIYTLPNIEVQDAFFKLREQVKCYLSVSDLSSALFRSTCNMYISDSCQSGGEGEERQNKSLLELMAGLEIINATNLGYFGPSQKAEFFNMKAQFLYKLGDNEEANKVFSQAIQIDPSCERIWISWGLYNDFRFRGAIEEHMVKDTKEEENDTECLIGIDSLAWAGHAIHCYLQISVTSRSNKIRKYIPKILWLLSFEDGCETLSKVFDIYNGEINVWPWIFFIPQLLVSLSRREHKPIKNILVRIARLYPQSLYPHIRSVAEELGRETKTSCDEVDKDKVAHLKELLSILKGSHLHLTVRMENLIDGLFKNFSPLPCEKTYGFICRLLDEMYKGYINGGSVAQFEENIKEAMDLIKSSRSIDKEVFPHEVPPPSVDFGHTIQCLRKWKDILELELQQKRNERLDYCLTSFYSEAPFEIELFGQYSDLKKEKNEGFVKILGFSPFYSTVCNHGVCYKRFTVRCNDGLQYRFLVYNGNMRKRERFCQILQITNHILNKNIETRRRGIEFNCPYILPLSSALCIVGDNSDYFSFEEIFEDHYKVCSGGSSYDILERYKEALGRDGQDVLVDTKTKVFCEFTKDSVSDCILGYFIMERTSSSADYYLFRKQFTRRYSTYLSIMYLFRIGGVFLHKIWVSFRNGDVFIDEMVPVLNQDGSEFVNDESVPFRLTPNIQRFVTEVGIEGVLSQYLLFIARSLIEPEFSIEDIISLFVRDDISTRSFSTHIQDTEKENKMFRCIYKNIRSLYERLETLSCRKERADLILELTNHTPGVTKKKLGDPERATFFPLHKPVIDIISESVSPSNLSQMDPLWHPWF